MKSAPLKISLSNVLLLLRGVLYRHSIYIAAMTGASLLGLVKLGLFAQHLDVVSFGEVSLALVVLGPISFVLGLGLEPYFLREGSLLVGRGHEDKIIELRNRTLTLVMLSNLIALGVWLSGFLGECTENLLWWSEVVMVASLMLTFNLAATYLRIMGRLDIFVNLLLLRQILALGLGLLWIHLGWNVLLAEGLSYALVIIPSLVCTQVRLQWPSLALITQSIKIGFPVSLGSLVLNASLAGDRWVLPGLVSSHDYGLYSFGMIAFTAGLGILNFLTPVLVPKWLTDYGRTADRTLLFNNLARFSAVMIGGGLIAGSILLITFYFCIDYLFVQYRPAFPYLCVISFATILHMANPWNTFFLAIERGIETLRCQGIVIVLQGLLYLFSLHWPLSLMHFALIFLASRLFAFLLSGSRSFYLVKEYTSQGHSGLESSAR